MIYAIPLSQAFIPALAQGLLERYPDPQQMARCVVLLPTRRGCLALRQALINQNAHLFPKIIALADLESTPLLPGFLPETPAPSAISDWRRQGILTQLVYAFEKQKDGHPNVATATALAKELMQLIDEAATSCVDLQDLKGLVSDDYAQHWQLTLDFLKILTDTWPAILAAEGLVDKAFHNRENLLKIAAEWTPDYPVILAGTTGTRPATALLAKAILGFKEGCVVLPGFDPLLPRTLWETLPPTHPQAPLVTLLTSLEAQEVNPWVTTEEPTGRHIWLSQAMLPSFEEASVEKITPNASDNVVFITADHRQDEARTIAAIIRKELEEPGKTVAVITPDQNLTKRLTAELSRWNITPNTSSGMPLSKTVVGTFLLLTAKISPAMSAADLLALLKHPLCFKGENRFQRLLEIRRYEMSVLRQKQFEFKNLPADILLCFEPILSLPPHKVSLSVWLKAHRLVAENLAGSQALASDEDGRTLTTFFDELMGAAADYPPVDFYDYAPLLQTLMAQMQVRHPEGIGSRAFILGTLEARLHQADVTILAGLNEGIWPQESGSDPWLSRPMRLKLGLPDPERRIGLSAHDFCLCFTAPKVYLTRSQKIDGAPAIASRWWQRLEAVAAAAHLPLSQPDWLSDIALIDVPLRQEKFAMPAPCPSNAIRPKSYSVSDIGRLMRDPYSLYAKKILKLRPLPPLTEGLEAKDKGDLIHQALEMAFETGTLGDVLSSGEEVFKPYLKDPIVKHFWWPRFCAIAGWVERLWETQKENVEAVRTEIKNTLDLVIQGEAIQIHSIADRIDVLKSGAVRIIDYKTGTPPTQKDVRQGLAPQLTLEALMMQEPVEELAYWQLKGDAEGGQAIVIPNLADRLKEAKEGVTQLLETFLEETTPYCPATTPVTYNEYEHLERLKEWG